MLKDHLNNEPQSTIKFWNSLSVCMRQCNVIKFRKSPTKQILLTTKVHQSGEENKNFIFNEKKQFFSFLLFFSFFSHELVREIKIAFKSAQIGKRFSFKG